MRVSLKLITQKLRGAACLRPLQRLVSFKADSKQLYSFLFILFRLVSMKSSSVNCVSENSMVRTT